MKIHDSRDLQERLDELQAKADLIEEIQEELAEAGDNVDTNEIIERLDDAKADFDEDEQTELKELKELSDEVPEWEFGATLICVDDWVDYVKEMLEDCGDIPKNLPSYIEIDWEKTADNIEADYSTIDYQGDTYYYRNC